MSSEKPVIPVLRARQYDMTSLYSYICAAETLEKSRVDLQQRLAVVPMGRERMETIASAASKLLVDLLGTYPPEKRDTIRRMIPKMHYRVMMGKMASKDPEMTYIRTDDVDTLCGLAHETCKICLHPEACDRCALGKLFDHLLTVDRMGGSWLDYDLTAAQLPDVDG